VTEGEAMRWALEEKAKEFVEKRC